MTNPIKQRQDVRPWPCPRFAKDKGNKQVCHTRQRNRRNIQAKPGFVILGKNRMCQETQCGYGARKLNRSEHFLQPENHKAGHRGGKDGPDVHCIFPSFSMASDRLADRLSMQAIIPPINTICIKKRHRDCSSVPFSLRDNETYASSPPCC